MTLDLVALADMGSIFVERKREGGDGVGRCRIERGNWSLSL